MFNWSQNRYHTDGRKCLTCGGRSPDLHILPGTQIKVSILAMLLRRPNSHQPSTRAERDLEPSFYVSEFVPKILLHKAVSTCRKIMSRYLKLLIRRKAVW